MQSALSNELIVFGITDIRHRCLTLHQLALPKGLLAQL